MQYKRINHEFDDNVENLDISELERKVPNKGPLYEFIKHYINGNKERVAKMSLQEYYILSSAEYLLLKCDPNSEWTYRYPEDIPASTDVPPTGASPFNDQFRNNIDCNRVLDSNQMAGTYPQPSRKFPQIEPDERTKTITEIQGRQDSNLFKKIKI